jgi:hypothetical protein
MSHTIEGMAIWILEALDEERQNEQDLMKCRPSSLVFGELKTKHGLEDKDINRGLRFCLDQGFVTVLNRPDGQAMLPSKIGIKMLGEILMVRHQEEEKKKQEEEKKKWTRADKIALASLIFSVLSYFLGFYVGKHDVQSSDAAANVPQQTNSVLVSPSNK